MRACELPGLSQLCGVMDTVQRLIFVVPEANFNLMMEQQLLTNGQKQMQPSNIHSRVRGVKQFVLALPITSGAESTSANPSG